MSKILPVEVQVVETAKTVLAGNQAHYNRKYSQPLVRGGMPTGKRSHKFFGVFCLHLTASELVDRINSELRFSGFDYEACVVRSPFHGYESITIRPTN